VIAAFCPFHPGSARHQAAIALAVVGLLAAIAALLVARRSRPRPSPPDAAPDSDPARISQVMFRPCTELARWRRESERPGTVASR
jgi:hypothetical protein